MVLKGKDKGLLAFLGVVYFGVVFLYGRSESVLVFVALGILNLILLGKLFDVYRNLQKHFGKLDKKIAQVDALFSLHQVIDIRHPMPPMSAWALSPDLANILIDLTLTHKPKTIVELGSGVSTLVFSYCLEKLGGGKVISLEAEAKYAEKTQANLDQHGLSKWAEVRTAPLKPMTLKHIQWQWYDPAAIEDLTDIDILFVDGPAKIDGKLMRYPAFPVFLEKLSEGAVIILDDADRKQDATMIGQWLKEFEGFEKESFSTQKGTVILRKRPQ